MIEKTICHQQHRTNPKIRCPAVRPREYFNIQNPAWSDRHPASGGAALTSMPTLSEAEQAWHG
ncbi:hypothetical protein SynA1528_02128 [Synechococcus sp. A15-28]|nr:hypothetical protein SynA1528_02128 [Synechococcus sp. A15-28]